MNARTKQLATAAVLLIAVLSIVTVLVVDRTPGKPAAAGHGRIRSAGCGAGPADTTTPASPPADVAWKSTGPILVPTSAAYGPTRYAGPIWSCYRHDPMGAVFAACDIIAASITSHWLQVAEDQFVPGQGQQAYIAASSKQTWTAPAPGDIAQAVGFQVVSYTPGQATIETLANADNGNYQVNQFTVEWVNGDWKLAVTLAGATGPDPQLASSANGFVLWGGGSNG